MKGKHVNMKSHFLAFILLGLTLCGAGGFMANSFFITANADPTPLATKVFVTNATANVGDNIEIFVNISDVEILTSLRVKLWWDMTTLEYVNDMVTIPVEDFPGGVLHHPTVITDSVNETEGTYSVIAVFTPAAAGDPIISFNGSGSVFTMEFKVLRGTTAYLHLIISELVSYGEFIEHEAVDGKFSTPDFVDEWAPFANFTIQPDTVFVNRTEVTFNASNSYDPDLTGNIDLYMWDLGDGTQVNASDPIVNLTYTQQQTVLITLVVRDNRGCLSYPVSDHVFAKTFIDIAIENVAIADSTLQPGNSTTIDVTVSNLGDETVYLSPTVKTFYNETSIDWNNPDATEWTQIGEHFLGIIKLGSSKALTYNWNTTDVTPDRYYWIKANTSYMPGDDLKSNNQRISDTSVYVEPVPVHDVAVTNVVASPTNTLVGDTVYINVTVTNEGDFTETSIDVTPYYDGTAAAPTKTVSSLAAGANDTLEFEWDTTDVSKGTYTISANASVVPDETETTDNTLTGNQVSVREHGDPVANFTYLPEKPLVGEEVTFNASASEDLDGTIESYTWDFGDGTSSVTETDPITTHTYMTFGSYNVALYVTDDDNQTSPLTDETITVYAPPVANFTYLPEKPLVGEEVTFNASASEDLDGTIESYTWDFGDGTSSVTETDPITTHTYAEAGTYTVILNVTDDDGLIGNFTGDVTVAAPALVHDVAVTNVVPSPTSVSLGQSVSITVDVKNEGDFSETFNVTAYYDNTPIETKSVTDLESGATRRLSFTWYPTVVGSFTISANASVVPGETDVEDNRLEGEVVTVLSVGPTPGPVLAIEFPGEREYYEDDDVKVRLVASVTYVGGPASNAQVTILIFDPEGELWVSDVMVEVEGLTDTGIYEWESNDTVRELELERGFYLIHVIARLGGLQASEISQFRIVFVEKATSIISIDANPLSVTEGSSMVISGAITPKRPRVTVTILYRPSGGTWTELRSVKTSSTGHYSVSWVVTTGGTYEVKASWPGDTRTEGAESEVKTVTVKAGASLPEIPPYVMIAIAAIVGSVIGSIIGPAASTWIKKPKAA